MIRVLTIDDHLLFSEGVIAMLESDTSIGWAKAVANSEDAFTIMSAECPDLVLLDINLGKEDGVAVCRKLSHRFPEVKIIALTMHSQKSFLLNMLRNGAKAYVLKNTSASKLLSVIHSVYNDEYSIVNDDVKQLLNGNFRYLNSADPPKISRREKEILRLIVEEYTMQEIAEKLFISPNTVENHRSNLLAKLNARNTAGLVRITIEKGLLD